MTTTRKNSVEDKVRRLFKTSLYDIWNVIYATMKDEEIYDVFSILEMLKCMSSYMNFNASVIKGFFVNDLFSNQCADILIEYATKMNMLYYSFLKEYLKNEILDSTFLKKKMTLLSEYLSIEREVKTEILSILENQSIKVGNIKSQIEEFLGHEIEFQRRLIEDGVDQYVLLALLSYIEMENGINDIDVMMFDTNEYYKDLIVKIYKIKIINSNRL